MPTANEAPASAATGSPRRARRRRRAVRDAARTDMLGGVFPGHRVRRTPWWRSPMTTLDWILVAFIVLLAFNGLRQGFIVGVLQLAGFVAGALIGSRVGPLLLSGGAHSPYA